MCDTYGNIGDFHGIHFTNPTLVRSAGSARSARLPAPAPAARRPTRTRRNASAVSSPYLHLVQRQADPEHQQDHDRKWYAHVSLRYAMIGLFGFLLDVHHRHHVITAGRPWQLLDPDDLRMLAGVFAPDQPTNELAAIRLIARLVDHLIQHHDDLGIGLYVDHGFPVVHFLLLAFGKCFIT
jgi:hypothetical protein